MLTCIILQIIAVIILLQTKSISMVWAFIIVFGFSAGAVNTLRPLVIGEFFGIGSFGKTFGTIELIRRFGAALGPFVAGFVFDSTGVYQYAFILIIMAYLAAGVMLCLVRHTRINEQA